jgi:hypothetical protein
LGRCRQAMERAERWLATPRTQVERRALRHFGGIVARVDRDKRFAETARQLEMSWHAFCELRDALRLIDADLPRGETRIHQTELPAEEQQRLEAIEKATKEYLQRLRDKVGDQPKKKPVTPEGVILKYCEKYGDGTSVIPYFGTNRVRSSLWWKGPTTSLSTSSISKSAI